MKYSVIIPLYNKQQYIQNTIQSVLNQTFDDYEIIIVDDGSSDDSLIQARQIDSPKIRIIEQPNQGAAVARNTAIENSQGEYVAFLDADDEWKRDHLESIDAVVQMYPQCDIFVTAYRIVMGKDRYHFSAHLCDDICCLDSYWMIYKNAYDIVWTSATVIRKSAIVAAGMFTPGEIIGEDLDLWARVACINPKVGYSPNISVDYNRGAEQNARTRIRIANPKSFMSVLLREMDNDRWTDEERKCMRFKYNEKMTVFIFTTILSNKRKEARKDLLLWNKRTHCKVIPYLYIASFLPNFINRFVYKIRLKVF